MQLGLKARQALLPRQDVLIQFEEVSEELSELFSLHRAHQGDGDEPEMRDLQGRSGAERTSVEGHPPLESEFSLDCFDREFPGQVVRERVLVNVQGCQPESQVVLELGCVTLLDDVVAALHVQIFEGNLVFLSKFRGFFRHECDSEETSEVVGPGPRCYLRVNATVRKSPRGFRREDARAKTHPGHRLVGIEQSELVAPEALEVLDDEGEVFSRANAQLLQQRGDHVPNGRV